MKKFTNKKIISKMVSFYKTIEAAREAYKSLRTENNNRDRLSGNQGVLWVSKSGEIKIVGSSEVIYKWSPDAAAVLPS